MMKRLPFKKQFSIFMRSLFVQAVWNYKSMISLGLCFTVMPAKEELEKGSVSYKEFVSDNIRFFNSHPYFAGFMAGLTCRLYEETPEIAGTKVDRIKNLLISPLGAVGDKLFWDNIKPAMMLMAVLGGIIQLHGYPGWIIMAGAFLLYNIPHLMIRWSGIQAGFSSGLEIYNKLNFESFEKMYKLYRNIGKLMWSLGLVSTLWISWKYFGLFVLPVFILNFVLTIFIYHYTNSVFRYLSLLLILNLILVLFISG